MRWRSFALFGIVALLGSAWILWYLRSPDARKAPATVEVKRGEIAVRITGLGELRAFESVTISAQREDRITYLVPEGTSVKSGEVLVRFDASAAEALQVENRARLEVARSELRKAERELEAQREKQLAELARYKRDLRLAQLDLEEIRQKPLPADLERARLELDRARANFEMEGKRRSQVPDLVRRGLVSKNAVDEVEVKYLEAKVGLQVAESNLSRVALGATPAEVERAKMRLEAAKSEVEKDRREAEAQVAGLEAPLERARAEVAHAKGQVDGAQLWLASTVLRAPRSGIVVYAKAGEGRPSDKVGIGMITREGQPILYLRDVSRMVVSTEINEADIGRVNLGAPVEARLESHPGAVFHGRVLRIEALSRVGQRRGALGSEVKVFDVTSSIEANDAQLRPGLTARIDLNVERHQNVVYIPVSAVTHGEGQPVVYVWNGGHAMRRKVVLGVSNSEHVVVKEGVRPGERLVLGSVTGGTE